MDCIGSTGKNGNPNIKMNTIHSTPIRYELMFGEQAVCMNDFIKKYNLAKKQGKSLEKFIDENNYLKYSNMQQQLVFIIYKIIL